MDGSRITYEESLEFGRNQSVLFPEVFAKAVVVKLDHEHSSSDGGALLLKAIDERRELSERLTACVDDPRQPGKVRHALLDLLRQRIYAIACGYPDGNDAARLAQDRPVFRQTIALSSNASCIAIQ
jgi:hypothetical protein